MLLIDEFISYLTFEKRYSAHTVLAYSNDLQDFNEFLQEQNGDFSYATLKLPEIRAWLISLKARQLTSKTLLRKISTLKSFFKFLIRKGIIEQNPMSGVISPKSGKRLPVYVESQAMEQLFTNLDPVNLDELTAFLALELLYNTGIRLSELIGLREGSVDFDRQTIRVFGKGNKERILPISSGLKGKLMDYLQVKHQEFGPSSENALLVNQNGKALYPKWVYRRVHQALSQVTTLQKKSPHVLRHTFATHLSNQGADLNAIKELLGHASLAATQIYTHNTIEKLKDIHHNAHPKS
ncbi:MAG: tyrosine-type recombinase/integrase [Chitinophagaceae bacterium]